MGGKGIPPRKIPLGKFHFWKIPPTYDLIYRIYVSKNNNICFFSY